MSISSSRSSGSPPVPRSTSSVSRRSRFVSSVSRMQCRITAEDPADDFRPDTGRIVAYRPAEVPVSDWTVAAGYQGAEITPYFDSLIEKITCRGRDVRHGIRRAQRALKEFRVRGVSTNLPFLRAILHDEEFIAGGVTTSFIDDRPELTSAAVGADRATRLLRYLANVTVNRPTA